MNKAGQQMRWTALQARGQRSALQALRSFTALILIVAMGEWQPTLAEAAKPADTLPEEPGRPSVPAFPGVPAQAAGAIQTSAPKSLRIVILDGEGALNNIKERTAREPIIQIEDENHKPVAGASVLFLIQNGNAGAGATFNSATSFTTVSDADGRAIGHGLKPNQTSGQYTISVSVTAGMMMVAAVIHMSNISGEGGGGSSSGGASVVHVHHAIPKWAIVGGAVVVATAVVVVTVVVATNNSKGATITPGTGTITP